MFCAASGCANSRHDPSTGAVRPQQGKGAVLVLPHCNTEPMSLHLAAIATMLSPSRHAVLVLDQAAWPFLAALTVPPNVTIRRKLLRPACCSPCPRPTKRSALAGITAPLRPPAQR